jgi:anti-sigma factor RsiW
MICPPEENIFRLIDGELSPRQEEAVLAHLESCPACRALYEKIKAAATVLKDCRSAAVQPQRRKISHCPDYETIIAYADGSMVEGAKRKKIAAHLARCDRCARKAARALETVRLLERIEEEGLRQVPPKLAERARERFFLPRSCSLGRITFKLKELAEDLREGFEYLRKPPRLAPAVAEGAAIFGGGQTSSPRKVGRKEWELRSPGLRITLKAKPAAGGKADLSVSISDDRARPLGATHLKLEKAGREMASRTTGKKGGASFPGLKPGDYRLFIARRKGSYLDFRIS